jgi:hypothetical protein
MPPDAGRVPDVSAMTAAELDRTRRDLEASLALAWPGSALRVPIEAHITAIDAELAQRALLRVCGCGLATDDDARMDGHLFEHPGHAERDLFRYQELAFVVVDHREGQR